MPMVLLLLLCAASAVPIWALLARFGVRQNGRLAASLLLPMIVCFAFFLYRWLALGMGPDAAENRGWLIVGFIASVLVSAIPALIGFGIGFLMESRYGHNAP